MNQLFVINLSPFKLFNTESTIIKKGFLQVYQFAALLKNRLWHTCFSVNFEKVLRTSLLQNISGQKNSFFSPLKKKGKQKNNDFNYT